MGESGESEGRLGLRGVVCVECVSFFTPLSPATIAECPFRNGAVTMV